MPYSQAIILQALGCSITLSKLLSELREKSGKSRIAFAGSLGISTKHLANIEDGKARVLPKHAAHYAQVLKQSEEQFIRLALQDMIDKDNLDYNVVLEAKKI